MFATKKPAYAGLVKLPAILLLLLCSRIQAGELSALQDEQALDPDNVIFLEQNWNDEDRQWFYHLNQGSSLLTYDLFVHLEQHDNGELLRDPLNMMRFGLLPGVKSAANPDALPIGFARNGDDVGLTCAACHTQHIRHDGKLLRIDGGQAMLDLQLFLENLEKSLAATLNDSDKLARLGRRYHGDGPTEEEFLELKNLLEQDLARISDNNRRNHTQVPYGFTRLDAFGAILNKGLAATEVEDNFNEPDAPTSYPYLWDTPQHDYVEWNGSQANSNIGALARNVGEVIGVFGRVETTPATWLYFYDAGYLSTVHASNLRAVEKKVAELHSPLWPEFFPAIDHEQAARGRVLYEQYCLSCHQDIDRTDPKRLIKVRMGSLEKLGTDPKMAQNVLEMRGKTGIFLDKPRFYLVGSVMGEEEPALFVANNLMGGVLRNNPLQSLLAIRDAKKMGHPEEIHPPKYLDGEILARGEEVSDRALLAYKARPLNGIWTGAPYLHNGSVPNLYELMLPAAERSGTFYIGSWEYDPVRVGYVNRPEPGAFLVDTGLPGNSNAGHEYGTGWDGLPVLTDEEIWALVEYMKTL